MPKDFTTTPAEELAKNVKDVAIYRQNNSLICEFLTKTVGNHYKNLIIAKTTCKEMWELLKTECTPDDPINLQMTQQRMAQYTAKKDATGVKIYDDLMIIYNELK